MKKNRIYGLMEKIGLFKMIKIMRFTIFILFLSLSQTFAVNTYSQQTKLSLDMRDARVEDVIDKIEKNSEFFFMYNKNMIDVDRKVDIQVEEKSVKEVLDKIFANTGITYSIKDRQILLINNRLADIGESTTQLQKSISGKVTDSSGGSLPGVSVVVKNTTIGTITDSDGKYILANILPNAILQFSFVGMKLQEVAVSNKSIINIVMEEESIGIAEVVAVGYGKSSKKEVTGSISNVKAESFNRGVVTSPAALLEGKVAGLNITKDGNPNSSPSVTLRGPSTIRANGASPFYVIDGVPDADYNLIAPDDIVSIDVLKDASAAAIYGTRAANGVILITTKRAKVGQVLISYNAYGAIESISNKLSFATGDQLREFLSANGKSLKPANDMVGVNTDWQDEIYRTGYAQNHNFSFGTANEKSVFGASINYLKNDGIVKTSGFDRLLGRLNLEQKALNDKLKLSFALSNAITNSSLISNDATGNSVNSKVNVFGAMATFFPTVTARKSDGTFLQDATVPNLYNPVELITDANYKRRTSLMLANTSAELKLPLNLVYNMNLSYQRKTTENKNYLNKASFVALNLGGQATRNTYTDAKQIFENYLSFSQVFANKHDIKALLGYSFQDDKNGDGFQSTNENFITDDLGANNLSLGFPTSTYRVNYGTTTISPIRMISFYGRLNYNYSQKYIIAATIRKDGSSAFGKNNRWGYFPSVSAAWRIQEENFMKDQNIFNELKFRAGYGVTGNSIGFDPLTPIARYNTTGSFYSNGIFSSAIGPSSNPNPDLKWESTSTTNIGLDFSVLQNRISGSIDWYSKQTKDLIASVPVSTVIYQFNSIYANVGNMSNKGIELSLTANVLGLSKLTWDITANASHNVNLIKKLGNDKFTLPQMYTANPEGPGQTGIFTQIIKEGYPLGQFYTLKYLGKTNGISTFQDRNGNPTTSPTSLDQTYIGNSQPKLIFGLGNKIGYENWTFSFFFRGQFGNKIMNATLASANTPTDASNHNIPTFTLTEDPNDSKANYYSDRYIEDGSFVRLDNATLSYQFKLNGKNIKGLRIYVTGTNLFIITKYTGTDPELDLGGISSPGVDSNNYYPRTRSFSTGVQIDL